MGGGVLFQNHKRDHFEKLPLSWFPKTTSFPKQPVRKHVLVINPAVLPILKVPNKISE